MILKKIGIIHSVYEGEDNVPRQGKYSDEKSVIEIFPEYIDALDGVEFLKSIIVLYWGDRANRDVLKSTPPFATLEKGVFSTRSPNRPNPIAICVCKILSIEANKITVLGLDALNNSPLLDIKVFIPRVDTDKDYKEGSETTK
ncbi:tRNA (N6-threonylcarbamoyladenosine(37)-N6)-methyltransferase TrmO [Fusobacterium simiae]|uniref:tRNA (N6-threonylcarbamoyladenosine(37)-N6)-methyltransferase TrmO n=1 Tax=Fusobacterium simiae TaxID=855 RepID=A0ABT4DFF5_FUSSI|nr:tRNA (N6-threonylcarbamoyladenosine(37)-N6)-methyltransferase TrmO [Fusobacterium simiae]MCY7007331.1 tRNA (N6-threonylcarbamoyladenosine(37)-N6)-methyltransferase TrmO [Fusobacterium simiae]